MVLDINTITLSFVLTGERTLKLRFKRKLLDVQKHDAPFSWNIVDDKGRDVVETSSAYRKLSNTKESLEDNVVRALASLGVSQKDAEETLEEFYAHVRPYQ
tara:strand:+ start:2084 stop:2386 length:303 start_codon:yes stop_codon:yes gene_type:complete